MFWGVAADRNPVAATLLRNIILVAIPPPSFGPPLWRVQTWDAPPRHSQVALFTGVRGREVPQTSRRGGSRELVLLDRGNVPWSSCYPSPRAIGAAREVALPWPLARHH
jgi:hypothetical protein